LLTLYISYYLVIHWDFMRYLKEKRWSEYLAVLNTKSIIFVMAVCSGLNSIDGLCPGWNEDDGKVKRKGKTWKRWLLANDAAFQKSGHPKWYIWSQCKQQIQRSWQSRMFACMCCYTWNSVLRTSLPPFRKLFANNIRKLRKKLSKLFSTSSIKICTLHQI
jgi:hypothetical protein